MHWEIKMRIKQLGHPILRTESVAVPIEKITSDDVQLTLQFMKDTLNGIKAISVENGNALSAPQVGHAIRAIMLRIDGVFAPMINPTFTRMSDEMFEFEEECFSLYNVRAKVLRHQEVDVHYYDDKGLDFTKTLTGEFAGLVQHEVDHLNGVFFLDRVEDKESLTTVDYILHDNPERLKTVQKMMAYMAR